MRADQGVEKLSECLNKLFSELKLPVLYKTQVRDWLKKVETKLPNKVGQDEFPHLVIKFLELTLSEMENYFGNN